MVGKSSLSKMNKSIGKSVSFLKNTSYPLKYLNVKKKK